MSAAAILHWMALPGRSRPGKPPSLIRRIGGTKHPEIGGCFVREKLTAPAFAQSPVEHRELPPAVGLGGCHEGRFELQEAAQAVCLDEADNGLVVGRRGRVEAVR